MRPVLRHVGISGFHSIKTIDVEIEPLLVLIGSNGAGKSNIVDAIELLADVYRIGLDASISEIGGLEAALHRGRRKRESNLRLSATVDIPRAGETFRVKHEFELESLHDRIGRFRVNEEALTIGIAETSIASRRSDSSEQMSVRRNRDGLVTSERRFEGVNKSEEIPRVADLLAGVRAFDTAKLFLPGLAPLSGILTDFFDTVSAARVFQIAPEDAREDADRSHNPELSRFGTYLPVVLEWLREDHPKAFARIIAGLREAMPSLETIEVIEGHGDVRAIEFVMDHEPLRLRTREVSDGSIRYLGLLTALHDPRISFIMLEEPENSLHPWMIARLAEQLVEAARTKRIIVTTHSPFMMTHLPVDAISVVYISYGETRVTPIKELQPDLYDLWVSGAVSVFDSVESGAITEMIPSISE